MKSLLKVTLIMALVFASTFLVAKLFGFLTVEQIKGWFYYLKSAPPVYVGLLVAVLLFSDLFIAVPNLTITIFSGFFLNFYYGSIAALIGAISVGVVGYFFGKKFGATILNKLLKNEQEKEDIIQSFAKSGFIMILLSRAVPILPEVTAILAGMTGMSFGRFLLAWLISTVPYTLIGVYAGSVSSVENPNPAIITAILISATLWAAWFVYSRRKKHNSNLSS